MTYNEWSLQYRESADILKEKIDALKIEKKKAPLSELNGLDNRIKILSEMYRDCRETEYELGKRKGGAF